MEQKQRIIMRMLRFMGANHITLNDLQYAQNPKQANSHEMYDLLCVIDGIEQRIPFDIGKDLNPIGIFPFANVNTSLDLTETTEIRRSEIKKAENLMSVNFCKWTSYDLEKLNAKLSELHKPILDGYYHIRNAEHLPEQCWVAHFGAERGENMPIDFYDDSFKAKVRYFRHF